MTQAPLNMADGVRQFGRTTPTAVAVREDARELTFAALDERSSRLATALLDRGLRTGDPVALLSNNASEYFEVATALAKAGLPMVPLNPKNARSDNEYILGHSGARAVVVQSPLADNVSGLTDDMLAVVAYGPDASSVGEDYEQVLATAEPTDPRAVVGELAPFAIAYTSGTTGRPKGVLLTHRGRVLTAYGAAISYGLGPGRRTVAVAPMYLGAGFSFAYAGPQLGGTTTVLPAWDPEHFMQIMERDAIHTTFLVPTHAQHVRRLVEEPRSRYDLSSLHTLYFNAAALPVPLKEWVVGALPGVDVHELYGSTEASIVTSLGPADALRKAGSVGHPWFMNEVRLLDDDRNPVPAGTPGELFSRSPLLMGGYLHNEEATRQATTADGFVTVGDIAVADEEGFISIVDRKKDMIIAGGVNIFPREIEEVMARFEAIDECAVVGVPDETYGERIAAFVVARPGRTIDPSALEQHVRAQVASYKVPREWHVVGSLPRNPAGKILKTSIRSGYTAGTSRTP